MSISIHIPFYNPNPEKKEGYRNLRRFDYLEENVINLKTLSIKNDIFIHTHNDFLDDKNINAKIIKHKIVPAEPPQATYHSLFIILGFSSSFTGLFNHILEMTSNF